MNNTTKYTIPAMLQESVSKFADKISLVYAGESKYTYQELGEDVKRVAALLKKHGVQPGDKVAILSPNMPNWGIAFFSISWIGATAVPILPDFHSNEIESIIEHSETKTLFVSESLYSSLNENTINKLGKIILVDCFALIPKGTPKEKLKSFETELPETAELLPAEVNEEDLASIIYTSGTTGNSKGVMLTHKNLMWTSEKSYTLQDISETDRFLSVLPLSHTFENTLGFLFPVRFGASVHYLRKPPVASVLLPALKKVQPTIMLVVPLIIEKVFKAKINPKFQKSKAMRTLYSIPAIRKVLHRVAARKLYQTFGGQLRFFGIGGAKLDGTVERFLYEGKFPYAIGYGLTETSPLLAGAVGKNRKLGSTGIAMDGVQLRLGDVDPATGEGEIQAKGNNVMEGYYKAPEITKEVFTEDGWFKTGDKGKFDKNNFLYIKGRIKTMIVGASGENIYPEEIESVINKMRFVLESLVIEKKGKLVAMVHLNADEVEQHFKNLRADAQQYFSDKYDDVLEEIHNKVNAEVNKFSRLQRVVLQPSPFEKTPTQKIKRFLYA
ncbi:long-chain acyl-CoA synthetase [Tangfeifania diversioriginum]|uniref:Long-chain acyl-CoA synthetase n=1 Tax=Tangfeifania diversioriginum TaxID=1168035 RepID=A0A1M6DRW0_9BACT|nr:AMP-binding protein [Tangfeifania diversioriginum]SHI75962.1 long-chain acyl-CoA synthetase [Tangfeifania diversioriginum]